MVATRLATTGPATAHQHQRDLAGQLVTSGANGTQAVCARHGDALPGGDKSDVATGFDQERC
jgi:hypothetical protein